MWGKMATWRKLFFGIQISIIFFCQVDCRADSHWMHWRALSASRQHGKSESKLPQYRIRRWSFDSHVSTTQLSTKFLCLGNLNFLCGEIPKINTSISSPYLFCTQYWSLSIVEMCMCGKGVLQSLPLSCAYTHAHTHAYTQTHSGPKIVG